MVDGTGLENQRTKVPQVRILSLPPTKKSPGLATFLPAVLETGMFAFVAVLMVVITILTSDGFKCKFSCHGEIIAQKAQK